MRTALRLGSLGNVPDGNAGPGAQLQRLKAAGRADEHGCSDATCCLLDGSSSGLFAAEDFPFFNLEIPTFALQSQAGGGAPPPG